MKILHVQATLSPRYGGPATVLPQLVKAQADAGCEVVVATTNTDYPTGTYREPGWDTLDGGVPVFYASTQFAPLVVSASLARYLRRAIPGFDVVHVHGLYRFPPTFAARLCRRDRTPYIIRPHGSIDPYLYDKSTSGNLRLKRLYERWFDLPNLNAASAIHYTTEEERQHASFLNLRAPSFIVPNGLDWERYKTLPERGGLRARLGIGEVPMVLFLGRLHFKKGLDLLVPAFAALREQIPDAHLVIAGTDVHNAGYDQKIREWVSERGLDSAVHFVGQLQGTDVVQAYVDADVFTLPSYTENFGMAVAEAMACAAPVVISDQVNIHDDVSRAGSGLVIRCDVNELATALENLLRDPNHRRAMGSAGRQLVQDKYSWPAIVAALTVEYDRLIGQSRR